MNARKPPSKHPRLWTYGAYAALADGVRYQVFSGNLVREPAPPTWHQSVVQSLFLALAPFAEVVGGRLYLAPIDVVLDAGFAEIEVVQPDLLWVAAARVERIVESRRIAGSPDLAVEVLSPSNRRRDVREKVGRYRRFRVADIWIVDPIRQNVDEHVFADGVYTTRSTRAAGIFKPAAFPGWSLDLHTLWPEMTRPKR